MCYNLNIQCFLILRMCCKIQTEYCVKFRQNILWNSDKIYCEIQTESIVKLEYTVKFRQNILWLSEYIVKFRQNILWSSETLMCVAEGSSTGLSAEFKDGSPTTRPGVFLVLMERQTLARTPFQPSRQHLVSALRFQKSLMGKPTSRVWSRALSTRCVNVSRWLWLFWNSQECLHPCVWVPIPSLHCVKYSNRIHCLNTLVISTPHPQRQS